MAAFAPRPVVLVQTLNPDQSANFALFSFVMPLGTHPPQVALAITRQLDGGIKDTENNIRANGQFVLHLLTKELLSAALLLTANSGNAESLDNAPVSIRCFAEEFVERGTGPGSTMLVIATIDSFSLLQPDSESAPHFNTIARMGAREYLDLAEAELFQLD